MSTSTSAPKAAALTSGRPRVRPAVEADRDRWDGYVRKARGRGFCWFDWREALVRSYRVETAFLLAESEAGDVVGVAPIYFNRTIRGGVQGFALRHGLLADEPAAALALHDACLAEAERRRSKSFVATTGLCNPLPEKVSEVRKTVVLRLRGDEADTWQALRRETRVGVKRSRKHGTEIAWGAQHLPAFYDIYARNMLTKNVPIYSQAYFANILRLLDDKADLLVVLYEGRVIAGMVVLWGADTLDLYIGAWLRDHAQQVPYQRMYWEAICEAQKRGLAWVDMGESQEGSGTFKFKTNFGGEPRDVFYLAAGPSRRAALGADDEREGASARTGGGDSSLLGRAAQTAFSVANRSPFWLKSRVARWRRGHGRIV